MRAQRTKVPNAASSVELEPSSLVVSVGEHVSEKLPLVHQHHLAGKNERI
jgi:hypothetical protein